MQQIATLIDAGRTAIRDHRFDAARAFFTEVLNLDPRNEEAWLSLSHATPTIEDAFRYLDHLLTINPHNDRARAVRDTLQMQVLLGQAGAAQRSATPLVAPRRRYLLGEALVEALVITQPQLQQALHQQVQHALWRQFVTLGDVLLQLRMVSDIQLEAALEAQRETSGAHAAADEGRLGRFLVRSGVLTVAQLHQALARQEQLRRTGTPRRLGEVVIDMSYVSRAMLDNALSH